MATYVPVTVVPSGGAPFVQVSGNAPPMTVVPNAAPITLVSANAPGVVLYNPDGSPYTGGDSVAKKAAKRVLASVARGMTPITQTMSPAATVVLGNNTSTLTGANGFSGIPGGSVPSDQTKFRGFGSVWTQTGTTPNFVYYGYGMAGNIGNPANRRNTKSILTARISDAAFDFAIDTPAGDGSALFIALYATLVATGVRQRLTAADYTTSASNFGVWLKGTFSAPAVRDIEICMMASPKHTALRSISSVSGFTLPPADPVRARICFVGDSHVDGQGSGNTNPARLTFTDFCGERLGTQDVWCSSVGGRGFLNPGSLAKYRDSIGVNDLSVALIGEQDAIILAGTTNDDLALNAAYTDVAIQAEVQATVAAAMAAQPNALIFVYGPFGRTVSPSPNAHITPQSRYDAMKAGVLAAANGDTRVVWIDNSPSGSQWVTSGNVGTIVGPDGTHLNDAGMISVGYACGDAIIAACTVLAA